ncbi:hypothetical protein E5D57_001262 [Metarhizium anisopliae]|nr:hypothetical protein E5D57_001262 [Metarhizium anisopliae]
MLTEALLLIKWAVATSWLLPVATALSDPVSNIGWNHTGQLVESRGLQQATGIFWIKGDIWTALHSILPTPRPCNQHRVLGKVDVDVQLWETGLDSNGRLRSNLSQQLQVPAPGSSSRFCFHSPSRANYLGTWVTGVLSERSSSAIATHTISYYKPWGGP